MVLTARHCFENNSPDTVNILIGGTYLDDLSTFSKYKVVKLIMHPDTDVCLLQLDRTVDNVIPITLVNGVFTPKLLI